MKKKNLLFILITLTLALTLVACESDTTTGDDATQLEEETELASQEGTEVISEQGTELASEDEDGQETEELAERESFTGQYIVDVDYVKENYGNDDMILVDSRGEETARKGTVEGATAVSWQYLSNVEVDNGDYEWGLVLEPETLEEKLGEIGFDKDKEIILFSNGPQGWGEDARILWTLLQAGYENVKMVDGGVDGLLGSGLAESKDVVKLDPVTVEISELDKTHSIETRELEGNLEDYVMLDVREDEEWEGQVLYGEAQGGRVPGAIHIKYTDMFDENGFLIPNDEMEKLFTDAGIEKTDIVVPYCTAGIRSAYTQLVLDMLGFENAMNYDGSYYTWCANNDVEI